MENDLVKQQTGSNLIKAAGIIFFIELMGTSVLLYGGIMCVNTKGIAYLEVPMTLFIILMMAGPISGGHVNPCVSIATYTIRWKEAAGNFKWLILNWVA